MTPHLLSGADRSDPKCTARRMTWRRGAVTIFAMDVIRSDNGFFSENAKHMTWRPTRRYIFGVLTRAAAFVGFGRLTVGSAVADSSVASGERTLAAYLDTLIPDDELGPGAVRLGVDKVFLAIAAKDQQARAYLEAGLPWLDEQARKTGGAAFTDLSDTEREAVVAAATEAELESLPRRFFEATRSGAFLHYYAHPQAWAAIGYDGPPQPQGFTDYASPPKPKQ